MRQVCRYNCHRLFPCPFRNRSMTIKLAILPVISFLLDVCSSLPTNEQHQDALNVPLRKWWVDLEAYPTQEWSARYKRALRSQNTPSPDKSSLTNGLHLKVSLAEIVLSRRQFISIWSVESTFKMANCHFAHINKSAQSKSWEVTSLRQAS